MYEEQAMTSAQGIEKPTFEMMQRFDEQLKRYNRIISMTTALLEPVLLRGGVDRASAPPEEAPYHSFHELIISFERLNNDFEDMRSRIRV